MPAAPELDTTVEPLSVDIRLVRRSWRLRTAFTIITALILVAACFDYLGIKSRTLEHASGQYTTSVTYGQFTRRGITTALHIEIAAETAFDGDVTIAINEDYLDRFDVQNVTPQPDSETTQGDVVVLTFDQPPKPEFSVSIDASIDGAAIPGWVDGRLVASVDQQPIDSFTFRTWIWP